MCYRQAALYTSAIAAADAWNAALKVHRIFSVTGYGHSNPTAIFLPASLPPLWQSGALVARVELARRKPGRFRALPT
jgi:hypothetical protein